MSKSNDTKDGHILCGCEMPAGKPIRCRCNCQCPGCAGARKAK